MIPVSMPSLNDEDFAALEKAFKSGWISSLGVELQAFEAAFAGYMGISNCVSTSNGTTALQLALSALGVGYGDEVIVPDLTFAAVANAVMAVGAKPVCVDISPATWNIDPAAAVEAASAKTKAVIVVHSYGNPFDVGSINRFFGERNIPIIEDCAEAHGAEINGKKVGSFGLMAAFSFYANKIITTGEGGAVLTADKALAEKLRLLRDHGMDKNVRYHHLLPGFNYRMTNLQGAIGLSQLKRIDALIAQRDDIAARYWRGLHPLGFTAAEAAAGARPVNWLYTVLCPDGIDREGLMLHLKNHGVETRPMFRPISSFPYIGSQAPSRNAYAISGRGISLPTYNGLRGSDQDKVIELIEDYLG